MGKQLSWRKVGFQLVYYPFWHWLLKQPFLLQLVNFLVHVYTRDAEQITESRVTRYFDRTSSLHRAPLEVAEQRCLGPLERRSGGGGSTINHLHPLLLQETIESFSSFFCELFLFIFFLSSVESVPILCALNFWWLHSCYWMFSIETLWVLQVRRKD